jgi:hypothetical protein
VPTAGVNAQTASITGFRLSLAGPKPGSIGLNDGHKYCDVITRHRNARSNGIRARMKDQVHIRNAEAAHLARALARQTGKTISEVALEALRQYGPVPRKPLADDNWRNGCGCCKKIASRAGASPNYQSGLSMIRSRACPNDRGSMGDLFSAAKPCGIRPGLRRPP